MSEKYRRAVPAAMLQLLRRHMRLFVPGGICLNLFIFVGFTKTIFKQGVYHTEREVQITNPVEHNALVIFQDSVDAVKRFA